jgi:Protein of unknown function (DUF4232)
MSGRTRIILAATAAIGMAAAGGTMAMASAAGTSNPASVTAPRCTTGELTGGLHGFEVTPSGNRGMILTLTNISQTQSCSLYGYPGLALENAKHKLLRSHTFWGSTAFNTDPGRHVIVLSPGETASANVAYLQTGTDVVNATYLVVTPPNDYKHLLLGFRMGAGQLIHAGNLHVTAMARHTRFG